MKRETYGRHHSKTLSPRRPGPKEDSLSVGPGVDRILKVPILKVPILKENRNFWRREKAERFGVIIDACAYFKAFTEAALQAERQILILGWDTDSRVELLVDEQGQLINPDKSSTRLKEFLSELCERKPHLHVHILSWDFNVIYALEREVLPKVKFDWGGHPNLHFELDGTNRTLGSHHQKVVVIDDRIAFSGGLDLCARRWDTPEHLAHDARRTDPWGKIYDPFHDVQACVEGDAARALGDLARERWYRATGERVPAVGPELEVSSRWPASAEVTATDVAVAISRTLPPGSGQRPVREVERLFADCIARARRFIFFEAQYLSSRAIARRLAKRLREPNGPEVVMVMPRDATGWIEESTMSVLRARAVSILSRADRFGRFRIYHPVVPGLEKGYVKVHSKVTIVDDLFLRIGSANLNQRSMGLDTECDLSIESGGDSSGESGGEDRVRRAIASVRARLLAEHLDVSPQEVEERFRKYGSLIAAIESLRGRPRTLVSLARKIPEWLDIVIPEGEIIDPSGPYRLRHAVRRYFPNFADAISGRVPWLGRFKILNLIGISAALFFILEFVPFSVRYQAAQLAEEIMAWRSHPGAPILTVILFIISGIAMVPLLAMILATAVTFAPTAAFAIALVGTMASAWFSYWLGGRFGGDRVALVSNRWLRKVKDKIAQGGWLTVAVARMVPIAPFTAVNLVAGSIKLPLKDFLLGTLAGTMPGLLAMTLLAGPIGQSPMALELRSVLLLSVLLLTTIAGLKAVKHFFLDRYS